MNTDEQKEKEARWISDKQTLDTLKGKIKTDEKGLFKKIDLESCVIMRVLTSNADRWVYEENEKIKKEKGIEIPENIFNPQTQVKFYTEEKPIFYDRNCMWWVWNEKEFKWVITDEVDILNEIQKITGEDIITPRNRTLILNSLKQECRKCIPKPIKLTWIQFKNKIVDIETNKYYDATPDYFVTNPIPWEIGEHEGTPVMDKIFKEWVGEEYVQTLYEIIAYCLLPDYPMNRLFCLIGGGMNGKSKYLELVVKFLGGDNCTSTELDILLKSRFEITKLHKKLCCVLGETNFNEISQTSILKKLTGGDLIGFEYKNKNPFEDKNYAKIIIATNNLPTTTDKTLGFYRRWLIIDFFNKFKEKKNILEEIPEEEYNNLSFKCIQILKHLFKEREFYNEGDVDERMRKYEAYSDFLQKFIDDFVSFDNVDGYITKNDFAKKFGDWCHENRHRQLSDRSIGLKMKQKGIEEGHKSLEYLFDGRGGKARVWYGISWKEN